MVESVKKITNKNTVPRIFLEIKSQHIHIFSTLKNLKGFHHHPLQFRKFFINVQGTKKFRAHRLPDLKGRSVFVRLRILGGFLTINGLVGDS